MRIKTALVTGILAACGAMIAFADSLNNPGWPQTNVVYAAIAGYARTGGTSVVATATAAALVTETNRAQVAENVLRTNYLALIVAETNRAQVAENVINTNFLAFRASDTNRIKAVETKVATVITNTYISAIFTNSSGGVTNYTTTNVVRYVVP
jgi:hypothetical protein